MNRSFVRFVCATSVLLACVFPARAEQSVTYNLSMPRYYKDGILLSGDPSFISGTRGAFTSLESFSSSATYAVNSNMPEGYYVSKWQLDKAWGAGTSGTTIESWGAVNGITVTFDYSWARVYGTVLELVVRIDQLEYDYTFDSNGGYWSDRPDDGTAKYFDEMTLPAGSLVTRMGYGFSGWNTAPDGSGIAISPGGTVDGKTLGITENDQSVTFYAQWNGNTYPVTLNKNGGTCADLTSYTYGVGATLPVATKAGNTFGGWYDTPAYNGEATTKISTTDSGPKTFYAKFTPDLCDFSLEIGKGIASISFDYVNDGKAQHEETTVSKVVQADWGSAWSGKATVKEGYSESASCTGSGTVVASGARFAPTAAPDPYKLDLTPGTGIAAIFYKTNSADSVWLETTETIAVSVSFGAEWAAYATAKAGYTYTMASETTPQKGVMTMDGASYAPKGTPNKIWVRYDRNGGGDAGQMDDSEFTYDVEAPLRNNAFARSCTIHYNGNGATSVHENDVSGYKFAGWRDTPNGLTGSGHYFYTDGQRVTNPCGSTGASASDPVILYAQWEPLPVSLPSPVRSGYDFSGWYTRTSGGQRVGGAGDSYAATESVTLYAHWRAHVTKLRFIVGEEEVTDYAHAVANGEKFGVFGSLPELTSDDPKKVFLGWYTTPEGDGTKITDATTVELTGSEVRLYARWETVTYTITYETNGGTINEYAKTGYSKGQSFSLPTNVTRTDGRTFDGWYDNPTFEGDVVERIQSTDSGNKTFYAKWSELSSDTITLTFVNVTGYEYYSNTTTHVWGWKANVDSTTPTLTQTYAKGASITLPQALFSKEGYAQVGWRREGDSHTNPNAWDAAGVGDALGNVTQDRTYHTIWEANTYTVKYVSQRTLTSPTVAYGAVVPYWDNVKSKWMDGLPVDVDTEYQKTHQFVGWALHKDGNAVYDGGEMVSNLTAQANGVVTLYAVWKPIASTTATSANSTPKLATTSLPVLSAPLTFSTQVSTPSVQFSTPNPKLTTLDTPLTYTLHFSPGADVVNPTAMTNWENCVSGEAITPDCLYTNVYSDGFLGWVYNGQTNTTVSPVAAFDGQIITLQAAWKSLTVGMFSPAVGLTNVELKSPTSTGAWTVQTTGGVDKDKPSCLLANPMTKNCTLSMQVNGSGKVTYYWRYDTKGGVSSNILDGVATAIASSKVWTEQHIDITGDGSHEIVWFVPKQTVGTQVPYFFIDKVRWEPTPRSYEISTTVEPDTSGTTSGGGSYAVGETATLIANPADGYLFVQWNDGATNLVHKTPVWGDITNYVAMFRQKSYTVTGTAIPSEGGSVKGGGTYFSGTTMTLEAEPTDEHWIFSRWSDGVASVARQITVTTNATYTALFTNQYEITAVAIPSEGGTVTGGGKYAVGTTAVLTANPRSDDWAFVGWRDGYPSSERSFTVTQDATYTALFTNQYLVTVTATPTEGGTVAGGGRFVVGATTTLSATANDGYTFAYWSDGSTDVNHTITVLCETNLTATFSGSGPTPPPEPPEPVVTNCYYVVYDGNGATGGSMPEQTNVCGAVATLLPNAFTKTGYTFGGWVDKSGKSYTDGQTLESDLATTNRAALLKVVWAKTTYRIDFDANGGRGEMESVLGCQYGTSYQLPACTFTCDKQTFKGWATNATGSVVYDDGDIVRSMSSTGGIVALYAIWDGRGQVDVNITGKTATKYYTGLLFTVSGYDVEILSAGYYVKDFTTKPDTATTITESEVKYDAWGNIVSYAMGLTADSFSNKVASVDVLFNVEDGWLKILPSQIGGEPTAVSGSRLSMFDCEGVYGKTFDGSVISNAYAKTGCGVTQVEYAAVEGGPWSTNAPVFTCVGATSIWYRVTAKGHEPYAHEVAVRVVARYITEATIEPIADQDYTGTAVQPDVVVKVADEGGDDVVLEKDVDYYLTYQDNVNPGAATACVHGIGHWQGEASASFRIVGQIPSEPGAGFSATAVYDGQAHTIDAAALTNAYVAAGYVDVGVTFGAAAEGPWEALPPMQTDAGTRKFWYRVTAQYRKPFVHDVQVTVTPRTGVVVSIAGHAESFPYDGTDKTATGYAWNANDPLYVDGSFRCAVAASVTRRDVGVSHAGITAACFENTNGNFADVRFVITQDVSVTVVPVPGMEEPGSGTVPPGGLSKFDVTAVFDGRTHTIDVGALTNAFACVADAVTYAPCEAGPWSADPIAIVDVGATSFWYRVSCDGFAPHAHAAKVTVTPRDIALATIAAIPKQAYVGEPVEPPVTVTDGDPSIISPSDYAVSYSDNTDIGEATVTLTGRRNYTGTTSAQFVIGDISGGLVFRCGQMVLMHLQAGYEETIKRVSGLPTGLKYTAKTGYLTGTPTRIQEKKVTITFADRTRVTSTWSVVEGENNGVQIDFGEAATGEGTAAVSIGSGSVSWAVTCDDDAKVTMKGLPSGLNYTAKKGTISGTPKKAGTYKLTVKTTAGGWTRQQTFVITVLALPTYMVGTYYGVATNELGSTETFQLKLTALGKVSGYFNVSGKKVSFKATMLDRTDAGSDARFAIPVTYKYGRVSYTDTILLATTNTIDGVAIWRASLDASSGDGILAGVDAQCDVVKALGGVTAGTYQVEDEAFAEGECLNVKVSKKGAVKVSGKLANANGKLVSVSYATQLMVLDENRLGCWIAIYKTVSRQNPIAYVRFWVMPDAQ